MLLLVGFSFLAGVVTILAPCIWPILPIIFSSSLTTKGKGRPLGISLGVIVSFSILTLFISYLVKIFHFDPNILRTVAVFVIAFLGLVMIIPSMGLKLEALVSKLTSKLGGKIPTSKGGFWPAFLTGIFLGVIWTPCAGPILATIAALSATNQVSLEVVAITFSYALGVGLPLFVIAYGSQKIVTKAKNWSKYAPTVQRIFGVIMILVALAIYTNYDQVIQTSLLDRFPKLGQAQNAFEENAQVTAQLDKLKGGGSEELNTSYPAPELKGITNWLNTDGKAITLSSLKGKVVLVDFWTYSCINCIRTLPHVTNWYEKYKDQGFVVIGVHTPEFEFEKDPENVAKAIKTYNINYPVAQDNDYVTWNVYHNRYWPAEYLIDANGVIRRTHFGEGEYDQTEAAIQELLSQIGKNESETSISEIPDQTPKNAITRETYLGSARSQFNSNLNLEGDWQTFSEYIKSGSNAAINYQVHASKVYVILSPPKEQSGKVKVLIDGKQTGEITVDTDKLYQVADFDSVGDHLIRLEFETPGTEAYTFTFG